MEVDAEDEAVKASLSSGRLLGGKAGIKLCARPKKGSKGKDCV